MPATAQAPAHGTTMMRVPLQAHATLQRLAEEEATTMQDVLLRAVEAYRREKIFQAADAAYAALRADPQAWREEQEERVAWDAMLMDGLRDD